MIKLSMMEKAVVISALEEYVKYCGRCLTNPENKDHLIFIETDLKISQELLKKLNP